MKKSLSKAIKAILEAGNYSVDAVFDGEDALDYLQEDNYDAVILDIIKSISNMRFFLFAVIQADIDVLSMSVEARWSFRTFPYLILLRAASL